MDNFDFQELDEKTQRHAFHIMMLAARTDNKIPWDDRVVARKIQAKSKVILQNLINISFLEPLEDASNTLASSADTSRVHIDKSRVQESTGEGAASADEVFGPSQFRELWDSVSKKTQLKEVHDLTEARRVKVRLRLKRHPAKGYWTEIMETIKQTPFLRGENDRDWLPSFDWLIRNDENAAKITEGFYGKLVVPQTAPEPQDETLCQTCNHLNRLHGKDCNYDTGELIEGTRHCAVCNHLRKGGCERESKKKPVEVGRGI